MKKRYFRKKDPADRSKNPEWIEMTGREYYRFVKDPKNQGRRFIEMDDVVLECVEEEYQKHLTEKNHADYLREQEKGWSIVSLQALEADMNCSGEAVLPDEGRDTESIVLQKIRLHALWAALKKLESESYQLIYDLYLSNERKTERDLAEEKGVSQAAINKRKKKALDRLKILIIKFEKNQRWEKFGDMC